VGSAKVVLTIELLTEGVNRTHGELAAEKFQIWVTNEAAAVSVP